MTRPGSPGTGWAGAEPRDKGGMGVGRTTCTALAFESLLAPGARSGAPIRKAARVKAERRSSGSPTAVIVASLLSMVLLPGLGAPAASAAPSASSVWAPQSSFGGPTIDEAPSNPLAIDSQQNILVANQGGPVMIFAPDPTVGGTLLTEFGVPGFSFGPRNIAVDSSDDTVY